VCQKAHWQRAGGHKALCCALQPFSLFESTDGTAAGDAWKIAVQTVLLLKNALRLHWPAVRLAVLQSDVAPADGTLLVNMEFHRTEIVWMSPAETQELVQGSAGCCLRMSMQQMEQGSIKRNPSKVPAYLRQPWNLASLLDAVSLQALQDAVAHVRALAPAARIEYVRKLEVLAQKAARHVDVPL
jgi:hypothetical protein